MKWQNSEIFRQPLAASVMSARWYSCDNIFIMLIENNLQNVFALVIYEFCLISREKSCCLGERVGEKICLFVI